MKIKAHLLIFAILLCFSCQNEKPNPAINDQAMTNLRLQVANAEGAGESNSTYQSLSEKTKVELWINKLNQINSTAIPTQVKGLVNQLILHLQKAETLTDVVNKSEVQNIAVELATLTPKDSYTEMFCSLSNFNVPIGGLGKPSNDFAGKIRTSFHSASINIPYVIKPNVALKACNCTLSCDVTGPFYTKSCTPTSSGCGFFLSSPCTAYS